MDGHAGFRTLKPSGPLSLKFVGLLTRNKHSAPAKTTPKRAYYPKTSEQTTPLVIQPIEEHDPPAQSQSEIQEFSTSTNRSVFNYCVFCNKREGDFNVFVYLSAESKKAQKFAEKQIEAGQDAYMLAWYKDSN